MQDKHVKILVIIKNGIVEEVRSNVKLSDGAVLLMDLDANPLSETQENHIAGQYPHTTEPESVDDNYCEEHKIK